LVRRGLSEESAADALKWTLATRLNLAVTSAELNESVIFSPNVWGTKQVGLATFLAGLPSGEREALLGMAQQVLGAPGLHIARLQAPQTIIRSAMSVGLIQGATVQSKTGAGSTYVFSPLLEAEDDLVSTTEALHLRKLFVAHIMFGHERASVGGGRIGSPAVLVDALVRRRRIGPASNIGTDYHLLEMAGVVAVDTSEGRPYLELVKPEIAEAGLEWIRRITDTSGGMTTSLSRTPAQFVEPEDMRATSDDGAANEILAASVNELRKEVQRDDPWS
jgi:hypothetical protein